MHESLTTFKLSRELFLPHASLPPGAAERPLFLRYTAAHVVLASAAGYFFSERIGHQRRSPRIPELVSALARLSSPL